MTEDPRDHGLSASDLRAVADRLYDADDTRLEHEDHVSERYGLIRSRLRGLADATETEKVGRPLSLEVARQIDAAYRRMAREAKYRPTAPSDGLGHITARRDELDLDAECRDYALGWWDEENSMQFGIGCCNFDTRPAVIYAIEAARVLCGGGDNVARKLLRMALNELEK